MELNMLKKKDYKEIKKEDFKKREKGKGEKWRLQAIEQPYHTINPVS